MMNETRFRAFYQEMFPRLWRYVHRLVNERSECDDVVQESFFRFLRAAPVNLSSTDQKYYLYRIATNLVRDTWRSKKSEEKWLEEQGEDEPMSESEPGIVAGIDITRALAALSPGQRSLVWLAYVDGYEHSEIANIVGVKPASVRVLLMRARKRLAEYLADDSDQIRDSA